MTLKILALGGDGIGPEVVDAALRVLEYTAGEVTCARKIETAVDAALSAGKATKDIGGTFGTDSMTDAVIEQFHAL